ncbi:MAG TPA: hypothetical protein VJP80_07705 [Candidatus Saccharimonadales bacterium]|nr:hypothetical protein [Candidatus Saccharimonadales bacterium]
MQEMPQQPSAEKDQPQRDFRLDEVLTVVTGNNFLNPDELQADPDDNAFSRRVGGLLGFMTNGDQLERHQMIRAADEVTPTILAEHPEIAALLHDAPPAPALDDWSPEAEVAAEARRQWVLRTQAVLGSRLKEPVTLSPLDPLEHLPLDPATEYEQMGGKTLRDPDEFLDALGDAFTKPQP